MNREKSIDYITHLFPLNTEIGKDIAYETTGKRDSDYSKYSDDQLFNIACQQLIEAGEELKDHIYK
jgi:hypothetical protein